MSQGQTADWTDIHTERKESTKSMILYRTKVSSGLSNITKVLISSCICVQKPLLIYTWSVYSTKCKTINKVYHIHPPKSDRFNQRLDTGQDTSLHTQSSFCSRFLPIKEELFLSIISLLAHRGMSGHYRLKCVILTRSTLKVSWDHFLL